MNIWLKKCEHAGIKHLNNPNAFIECSNTMNNVYENLNNYNPIRKRKKLVVFDDKIADIMTNKKIQAIVKEQFIRCRKLNISLVFITQSYFFVPKDAGLNTIHFIMKIDNRIELKNITTDYSADIDYNYFKKIYRQCTKEPYRFWTIDTTLPARDPLKFRKYLFDTYKNDNNWSD